MNIPRQVSLLVFTVVIGGTVTTAQDIPLSPRGGKPVSFGLKTGANVSGAYNITGEDLKTTPRPGFSTGVFLTTALGRRLALQPEVAYAQRGIRAKGTLSGAAYDLTRTTTYVDISVLLNIKATEILSVTVGPQVSFLTRQKDVFSGNTMAAQREGFSQDNMRKKTFAVTAGPQFNIAPFVLDARIGWDLLKNTRTSQRATPRYSYVWYQLTIGFRFT